MTDPVRVYPFSEEEADVGLTLTVGGCPVPLHAARVSAWPINRRWPGFQRPQSQTETVGFAGFELSGPAEVTVRTDRPVAGAVVRPRSRGIETVCRDGEIRFTLPGPGAYVLETGGPHGALHLFADAPGAPRPDPADPGLIYFGPGIHDAGEIELKSGQTLFLDEGAVVYARVVARDAENICIAGRGI
ncbi:MAG: hypothetical protein IJL69_01575, partial [Oscillospiraceae bacterium]|nr:hypothetical protein [Oscillospiraceae bacterium]